MAREKITNFSRKKKMEDDFKALRIKIEGAKLEKYLNKIAEMYKERNGLPKDYKFLDYETFTKQYFDILNTGKQVLFDCEEKAELASLIIMQTEFARENISYIEINKIITKDEALYVLKPTYHDKKEYYHINQIQDLACCLDIIHLNQIARKEIASGDIIIDDMYIEEENNNE